MNAECSQADGQSQSVERVSAQEHEFPLLRWMLDVRAELARGNVPRRVVSPQPKVLAGHVRSKRRWSEDALLRQLPDKRSRKLMHRAERRAQQAVQPAQAHRRGRHALKRRRAAAASAPPPSRSPTDQHQRGYQIGHAAGSTAEANVSRKQGRKFGKQKAKKGETKQLKRRNAKPVDRRSGAGKQHSGWSAD